MLGSSCLTNAMYVYVRCIYTAHIVYWHAYILQTCNTYMQINIHTHINSQTCTHVYTHLFTYTYISIQIPMHVHIYVHTHIYTTSMYTHVCVYVQTGHVAWSMSTLGKVAAIDECVWVCCIGYAMTPALSCWVSQRTSWRSQAICPLVFPLV